MGTSPWASHGPPVENPWESRAPPWYPVQSHEVPHGQVSPNDVKTTRTVENKDIEFSEVPSCVGSGRDVAENT